MKIDNVRKLLKNGYSIGDAQDFLNMKNKVFHYDKDSDCAYIYIKKSKPPVKTKRLNKNILIDIDSKGNIFGIEILYLQELISKSIKEQLNKNEI